MIKKGFIQKGFIQKSFVQKSFVQKGFVQKGFSLIELSIYLFLTVFLSSIILSWLLQTQQRITLVGACGNQCAQLHAAIDVLSRDSMQASSFLKNEQHSFDFPTEQSVITWYLDGEKLMRRKKNNNVVAERIRTFQISKIANGVKILLTGTIGKNEYTIERAVMLRNRVV